MHERVNDRGEGLVQEKSFWKGISGSSYAEAISFG